MTDTSSIPWDAEGNLDVLTFDLESETFALEATQVQEILDLLPETGVPGAHPLVGSVVNFRGKIIPLADLRMAFGMQAAETTLESRIVVIEMAVDGEPIQIGIRADSVHEVAALNRAASEAAPAVGMRWRRDYVRGLVRRPQGVIVLPDLNAIFSSILGGAAPSMSSVAH